MGAQGSKEHPDHHGHPAVPAGSIGKFAPIALHHPSAAHHLTALSISSPLPASAFVFPSLGGSEQAQIVAHQQQQLQQQLQQQQSNSSSRGPTGHKASSSKHHGNNRANLFAFPAPNELNGECLCLCVTLHCCSELFSELEYVCFLISLSAPYSAAMLYQFVSD